MAELNTETYDNLGIQIVNRNDIWTLGRLCRLSFCFGLALFVLILFVLLLAVLADAFLSVRVIRETELILLGIAVGSMASSVWGIMRCRVQLGTFSRRTCAAIAATAGVTCVPCLVMMLDMSSEFLRLYHTLPPLVHFASILIIPIAVFTVWALFVSAAWLFVENAKPFKIQDRQHCPQCGYCVRGVVSCICPECGRAFNETDLGVSSADFDQLIKAGTPMRVPEGMR